MYGFEITHSKEDDLSRGVYVVTSHIAESTLDYGRGICGQFTHSRGYALLLASACVCFGFTRSRGVRIVI